MKAALLGSFGMLLAACTDNVGEQSPDAPSAQQSAPAEGTAKASANEPKASPDDPIADQLPPWDDSECGDDQVAGDPDGYHVALIGLPIDTLRAAYGVPFESEDFRIGEPFGEFYGEYARSEADPDLAGVPAKVLTWQKSECNFSVFFVKRDGVFKVSSAFEWGIGADF
jgi:hypothetical protein